MAKKMNLTKQTWLIITAIIVLGVIVMSSSGESGALAEFKRVAALQYKDTSSMVYAPMKQTGRYTLASATVSGNTYDYKYTNYGLPCNMYIYNSKGNLVKTFTMSKGEGDFELDYDASKGPYYVASSEDWLPCYKLDQYGKISAYKYPTNVFDAATMQTYLASSAVTYAPVS